MYPYSFGGENKFLCERLSVADLRELLFQCFREQKLGKKMKASPSRSNTQRN